MKSYIEPETKAVALHTETPLFGPSHVQNEVGNGVQCGDARAGWEEPDWHEETE